MTKIDIFSGFLGAGKTTFIKKLIEEAYRGEKIVLIENEFGTIGIDSGFLQEAGIEINEMNSGCICCSLVGDFSKALANVIEEYKPDRILIEPSGVGKLSDVIKATQSATDHGAALNGFTTIVDATKCKMYMKNFGEFFNDQVANAGCIVLSHTDKLSEAKINECVAMLREKNPTAVIVTTPWGQLTGDQLISAMEREDTLEAELHKLAHEHHHHEHHHHDEHCDCGCHDHDHHEHHHDEHCDCGSHDHDHHEHHHDEHCDCGCHDHEHHEHHHDEHCDCGCHDHDHHEHHHHDEHCDCGCHDHDHHEHHHHHADEVFTSWGIETNKKFDAAELEAKLKELEDSDKYGIILRAKGIVASVDGRWINFDYIPGEPDVRYGVSSVIGRLCVIGSKINEHNIAHLFGMEA